MCIILRVIVLPSMHVLCTVCMVSVSGSASMIFPAVRLVHYLLIISLLFQLRSGDVEFKFYITKYSNLLLYSDISLDYW